MTARCRCHYHGRGPTAALGSNPAATNAALPPPDPARSCRRHRPNRGQRDSNRSPPSPALRALQPRNAAVAATDTAARRAPAFSTACRHYRRRRPQPCPSGLPLGPGPQRSKAKAASASMPRTSVPPTPLPPPLRLPNLWQGSSAQPAPSTARPAPRPSLVSQRGGGGDKSVLRLAYWLAAPASHRGPCFSTLSPRTGR